MKNTPPLDEPKNHPLYLILLAVAVVGSVPFLFINTPYIAWWGIPLWLWSSIFFTVMLALVTLWGIIRFWEDDRPD